MHRLRCVCLCLTVLSVMGTGNLMLGQTITSVAPAARPGDPLPGLSGEQLRLFALGREDFLEVEEPEEGLGPAFNAASCGVCHSIPTVGGAGVISEVRAGQFNSFGPNGAPTTSLIHLFSIPDHGCQPRFPAGAGVIARRLSMPIFGAGLVQEIPDSVIRGFEDPSDRNGDGVSGRAAIIVDPASGVNRVGRFGWKAQHATLLSFGADAYLNEMGITNDVFRQETGFGLSPMQLAACDKVPDPEDSRDPATGLRGIDMLANFMKFLAPVARGPINPTTERGLRNFVEIGCAGCHVPAMVTGRSSDRAFDQKVVNAFSDFLLHDIGTGDGVAQGAAGPNEIRTPALWGLRFRNMLMHDGESPGPTHAIGRHQGEASRARQRFERLSETERQELLAFLGSL